MRRQVQASSDRAPIRIVMDLTSSGGVDAAQLVKRGIALLALTMTVSAERPVELQAAIGLGGNSSRAYWALVDIPTKPLDLASACFTLASSGLTRGFGYGYLAAMGANGSWPWNIQPNQQFAEFTVRAKAAMGLEARDLFIPPAHVHDELIRDPVAFVKRALDGFNAQDSE
jgi:hypothetical protein